MELTCGLVLQERSGAMGRSTTLCSENDDDDDDNMVAVVIIIFSDTICVLVYLQQCQYVESDKVASCFVGLW